MEEITEKKKSKLDNKLRKSLVKRLTDWYVDHRKLIMGILCALTTACWATVRLGLTKGVLFIGKLGRQEYTEFYTDFRDGFLNTETNLVMTEFRTILFVVAIILLLCNIFAPASYERAKNLAVGGLLFNFSLITLGVTMLSYGVIMIILYKILSVASVVYVLMGVICLLLIPLAGKDFATEHPDKSVEMIGSYFFGVLGVALIVAMGAGNVKNEMTALREKEEQYHSAYEVKLWAVYGDYLEDTDNRIYLKIHFYNQYNTEGKSYDYEEVKKAFYNYHRDDGSSWKVYKDFSDDYFELARQQLFDNYEYTRDAMIDYDRLVQQKLYYDGYCYGYENNQPEIPEEVMAQACQEVDEMFLTEKNVEEYDKDIVLTVNSPLIVGEHPALDVSCENNAGEYSAYISNIGRVSYVGSEKYIEAHNYKSEDEFIIKDDSVYLLKLMVASDLHNSFSKDINISIKGIDYKDISIEEEIFGYKDELMEEECGAFTVYLWVTTGDCDGNYQAIESLNLDVPKGFCQGDSIESVYSLDTVKVDDSNAVLTTVSWEADYPSTGHYDETEFSYEPKMYKLYAKMLCETGNKFSEEIVCSVNGKKHPKCNYDVDDFWSGGYVSLWKDSLTVGIYYYRITTATAYEGVNSNVNVKYGSFDVIYDYAASGTTVTLEPEPARGYKIKEYRVEFEIKNADKYENWKPVINNNTFVMPAAPIKITAVFEEE